MGYACQVKEKYMKVCLPKTKNRGLDASFIAMGIFTSVNFKITKNMGKDCIFGSTLSPKYSINFMSTTTGNGGEDYPTAKGSFKK